VFDVMPFASRSYMQHVGVLVLLIPFGTELSDCLSRPRPADRISPLAAPNHRLTWHLTLNLKKGGAHSFLLEQQTGPPTLASTNASWLTMLSMLTLSLQPGPLVRALAFHQTSAIQGFQPWGAMQMVINKHAFGSQGVQGIS
jgi:hypothetical protein